MHQRQLTGTWPLPLAWIAYAVAAAASLPPTERNEVIESRYSWRPTDEWEPHIERCRVRWQTAAKPTWATATTESVCRYRCRRRGRPWPELTSTDACLDNSRAIMQMSALSARRRNTRFTATKMTVGPIARLRVRHPFPASGCSSCGALTRSLSNACYLLHGDHIPPRVEVKYWARMNVTVEFPATFLYM